MGNAGSSTTEDRSQPWVDSPYENVYRSITERLPPVYCSATRSSASKQNTVGSTTTAVKLKRGHRYTSASKRKNEENVDPTEPLPDDLSARSASKKGEAFPQGGKPAGRLPSSRKNRPETVQQKGVSEELQFPVYGNRNNHVPFLQPDILRAVLPFIMDESLSKCMAVCPHWFCCIYCGLKELCAPIVSRFEKQYCAEEGDKVFKFLQSQVSCQPLYTAQGEAMRVDLLIYAEVLPVCANRCTQIGYAFSYGKSAVGSNSAGFLDTHQGGSYGKNVSGLANLNGVAPRPIESVHPRLSPNLLNYDRPGPALCPPASSYALASSNTARNAYRSFFRWETLKKGKKRSIWMVVDKCKFHGDEIHVAQTPNVPTVCAGDCIEIPVTLANGFGAVLPDSIRWFAPRFIVGPSRELGQHYYMEFEEAVWADWDHFLPTTTERLSRNPDHFMPQWRLLKEEYTGIDVVCCRTKYKAEVVGEVPNCVSDLGGYHTVKPGNSFIICSLKRLGLQHDRFTEQQVRQGDTIKIYTVMGGSAF